MVTSVNGIGRIILVGGRRPADGTAIDPSGAVISAIPPLPLPSLGGFARRRDRERYHLHLDALRMAVRSGSPVTLICESTTPPSASVVEAANVALRRLDDDWSVEFLVARPGRGFRRLPESYLVSALGAQRLVDHLEALLEAPRVQALGAGTLERALDAFEAPAVRLAG